MQILLCWAVISLSAVTQSQEPSSVFRSVSFEEAKTAAAAEKRLLVIDFTASWCAPCKRMDATTWRSPEVFAWFDKKAVAIQVDIDEHPEIARELSVTSVPLVVVYQGVNEFDRKGGFQDAQDLLAWMEGIGQGKRAIDALLAFKDSTKVEPRSRLAKALLERRRFEEALTQYLWLWKEATKHAPSYRAVRLSYWAAQIGDLCRCYPPARIAFSRIRDQSFDAWRVDVKNIEAAHDWIALNDYLRNRQQTVHWYERVKGDSKWRDSLQELRVDVYEEYLERGNYGAAGAVYSWPGGLASQHEKTRAAAIARAKGNQQQISAAEASFRKSVAALYAATLAAGNELQAERVAKNASTIDGSGELPIALILECLTAGEPRVHHREWLDRIPTTVPATVTRVKAVRARLDRALMRHDARASGARGVSRDIETIR